MCYLYSLAPGVLDDGRLGQPRGTAGVDVQQLVGKANQHHDYQTRVERIYRLSGELKGNMFTVELSKKYAHIKKWCLVSLGTF